MSKPDYLTEDNINPHDQKFLCISFFNKKNIKQVIENNNDYLPDEEKEEYAVENNIFAFKFRGAFRTYDEAAAHAKKLQSVDEYHNVYVAESGKWCPFMLDDDDKLVESSEYANEELNSMMKKYMENQEKAKIFHEYRKNDLIKKNIEENLSLKKTNHDEANQLLTNTTDKEERKKIKSSLNAIQEQIEKLENKKKDLEDLEIIYKQKLKIGSSILEN
jgi:hypothetical protein